MVDATHSKITLPLALGLATVLAIVLHVPFHFGHLYGEPDTARFVNDAIIWAQTGIRTVSLSQYRYYISPGYIWLAKVALDFSEASGIHPGFVLNSLNVVAAIIITPLIFLLCNRFLGVIASLCSVVVLSFIPSFWLAGLYAFPHLLGMVFMVSALLIYDRYLLGRMPLVWAIAPTIFFLTTTLFLKADLYLSAIAIGGLIFYRQQFNTRHLIVTAVIIAIPVIILATVSSALLTDSPSTVKYMSKWNTRFPVDLNYSLIRFHIRGILRSMGVLSMPIFALSLVMLCRAKRYSLAILLASWAAIPIIFWFFRAGDSARHHFQSTIPVAIGIGTLMETILAKNWWRCWSIVTGLVLINFFYFPPSGSTTRPSGNLFSSYWLIQDKISGLHQASAVFEELNQPKKAFLGSFTNPYFINNSLYQSNAIASVKRTDPFGFDSIEVKYFKNKEKFTLAAVRIRDEKDAPVAASAYQQAGYRVFSIEYADGNDVSAELGHIKDEEKKAVKLP